MEMSEQRRGLWCIAEAGKLLKYTTAKKKKEKKKKAHNHFYMGAILTDLQLCMETGCESGARLCDAEQLRDCTKGQIKDDGSGNISSLRHHERSSLSEKAFTFFFFLPGDKQCNFSHRGRCYVTLPFFSILLIARDKTGTLMCTIYRLYNADVWHRSIEKT